MNATELLDYLTGGFPDLQRVETSRETGLFFNRDGGHPRGVCFATIKQQAENFQLSINAGAACFRQHFGNLPARFSRLTASKSSGALLPHPVHAWLGWVCLLNPEAETLRAMQPILEEAYSCAIQRYDRKFAHA